MFCPPESAFATAARQLTYPAAPAQLPSWVISRQIANPNSIQAPAVLIMEHPPTTEEAAARISGPTLRWRRLVTKMFYLFEIIKTRYHKLAEAETHEKSVFSERKKFLTADAQAPATCLHPQPHLRRANQYASWTVCSKCGARQTYTSKRVAPKGKARARSSAYTPPEPPTCELRTAGTVRQSSAARSSREVMNEPIHPELNATLQAMAASFQNVGETLRELAHGQSRMIMMMQQSTHEGLDTLSMVEAQRRAREDAEKMQVDSPGAETEEWSPVSENPNASDLP